MTIKPLKRVTFGFLFFIKPWVATRGAHYGCWVSVTALEIDPVVFGYVNVAVPIMEVPFCDPWNVTTGKSPPEKVRFEVVPDTGIV